MSLEVFTLWAVVSADIGDLRLAGGNSSDDGNAEFGRLEIFNNGGWGAVCDRTGSGFGQNQFLANFTDASVAVACRQLGFSEGVKTLLAVRALSLLQALDLEACHRTCSYGPNALASFGTLQHSS